jgi:DNA-binding winged helix-turn-helix (wHTH) protein
MSNNGTSWYDSEITGYRFEDYHLDVRNRELRRGEEALALNSKYFDVLHLLVREQGRLVEKQKIFEEVWEGVIVTDAALTQCIKDIRKLLHDEVVSPRFIKTVPKHGYMFIGQVVALNGETNAPAAAHVAPASPSSRPYKFLDYYTEHDAALFFGREAEVEIIASQILAHRSFILHGRSGAGKSSLLRAGLVPRLRAQGHEVFVLRCFTPPLEQMRAALQLAAAAAAAEAGNRDLVEAILRRAEKAPERALIFLLDQFEELFILLEEEPRQKFIAALAELYAHETLPVRFVFAIREDLLAEMSRLKSALPEIFHHEYRLQRLRREQAARAIIEPAKAAGCAWAPALVEKILADLSDGESVDPPQLQIVCDRLYDARSREGYVSLAAYEKLGTAAQILTRYLERVLQRFNAEDLNLAKELLIALISTESQRLVLRVAEVLTHVSARTQQSAARLKHLLEELARARIVRFRNHGGEGWIELAHDFLLPEISRWLTAEAHALKRARGVLERALENYRGHQLLLDYDALRLLIPFGVQLGLSGEEADLLLTSVLNRAQTVPVWLVQAAPSAVAIVLQASANVEAQVRLRVIEACRALPAEAVQSLVREMALWDRELIVRRNAALALAEMSPAAVERTLTSPNENEKLGLLRQSTSLAFIRDHDAKLVRLAQQPLLLRFLILLQLVWQRWHRHREAIVRQGVGGMLGAAVAGVIGGVMLGLSLAWIRQTTVLQGASIIIVLASLAVIVSGFGGVGVSFGMLLVDRVTFRHSRWWAVLGAALGGAAIGGVANWLSGDIYHALFGRELRNLTGALEGAIIGAGLAFGERMPESAGIRTRAWQRVLLAACGATCAGIFVSLLGGNLFTGSLTIVTASFSSSQLQIESLSAWFGEAPLGRMTLTIIGAIEAFLFGATVAAGMELARRSEAKREV